MHMRKGQRVQAKEMGLKKKKKSQQCTSVIMRVKPFVKILEVWLKTA